MKIKSPGQPKTKNNNSGQLRSINKNNNSGQFKSKNKARKEIRYSVGGSPKFGTNNVNSAKENSTPKFIRSNKSITELKNMENNKPFASGAIKKSIPGKKVKSAKPLITDKEEEEDYNREGNSDDSDFGSDDVTDSALDLNEFSTEEGEESDVEDEDSSDVGSEESDVEINEGESDEIGEEQSDETNDDEMKISGEEKEEDIDSDFEKQIPKQEMNQKNKKVKNELSTIVGKKEKQKDSNVTFNTTDKINKRKLNAEEPIKKKAKVSPDVSQNKFIAIIHNIPNGITADDVKSVLETAIPADTILSVTLKSQRRPKKKQSNCLIVLRDEVSLQAILLKKYDVNGQELLINQIGSGKTKTTDPLAFIPRLPLSISDENIKKSLEDYVGDGKVIRIKSKAVQEKKGYRNVLITFSDADSFDKALKRTYFTVNNERIILREAFESGVKITVNRAVYKDIPDGTKESDLKKTIESVIGKGTILALYLSTKNSSYAFVTFNNDEAQAKALANETPIQIGGSTLAVSPFVPIKPKKRSFKGKFQQHGQGKPSNWSLNKQTIETDESNVQTTPTKKKNKIGKIQNKIQTPYKNKKSQTPLSSTKTEKNKFAKESMTPKDLKPNKATSPQDTPGKNKKFENKQLNSDKKNKIANKTID